MAWFPNTTNCATVKQNIAMINYLQKQFKIWWIQVAYMVFNSGFVTLLYVYFVKNEVDFFFILLAESIGYGVTVLFLSARKSIQTKRDIQLGLAVIFIALLALFLPFSSLTLLLIYTPIKIAGAILFFVPYNVLFFQQTKKDKKLHWMTVYWAIGSVVGVVAPFFGGFIQDTFGIHVFVIVASFFVVSALVLSKMIQKKTFSYTTKQLFTYIKNIRTITMFDGALQNVSNVLTALYLITFVQGAFDFGKILSVIALFSVVLSFRLANFSDRYKQRFGFIWPLSFMLGILMMAFPYVTHLWGVVVLIVLFKLVSTLLNPIRSNILLDAKDNLPITWISREVYLNIGRSGIFAFLAGVVYFGFLEQAFILTGCLFFVFPIVVYFKRIY